MPAEASSPPPPAVLLCANSLKYLWKAAGGLIQSLQDAGYDVICAAEPDETAAALQAMECQIIPMPWTGRATRAFSDLKAAARLHREMKRRPPVAAFGWGSRPNLVLGLAAGAAKVPYVATVGNLGPDILRREPPFGWKRRLQGLTHAGAYATVFNNPGDLATFRRARLPAGRRALLLPGLGVNLDRFPFAPLRRPVATFLMIARLQRDKGVAEYLEAAERLKRERPNLRFLLAGPAGDGEHAMTVREVAQFGSAVEYLGETPDIRPILLRADCLVLPSYREGMPRPVMEAAAMGRLAVVSDVEGCRDAVLPDKTGLLCEAGSSSSLAEAMRRASRLRVQIVAAMSRQARELAVARFDERPCIDAYVSLAEDLAGARRAQAAVPALGIPARAAARSR